MRPTVIGMTLATLLSTSAAPSAALAHEPHERRPRTATFSLQLGHGGPAWLSARVAAERRGSRARHRADRDALLRRARRAWRRGRHERALELMDRAFVGRRYAPHGQRPCRR